MRALLLLAVVALALPARAQDAFGDLGRIPVDRLRPAIDGDGINDVESGAVGENLDADVALWGTYGFNPLTYSTVTNGVVQRQGVFIEHRFGASVVGALSLFEWVQLGFEVPISLWQGGGLSQDFGVPSTGLGDVRFVPKVRLLRRQDQFVDLALIPAFTLPSGGPFLGEAFPTFVPELALSSRILGVKLGANVATRWRAESLTLKHELVVRGGAGYDFRDVLGWPFEVDVSIASGTRLFEPFKVPTQNPTEVLATGAWNVFGPIVLFAGGGVGLPGYGTGFGVPDVRAVAGLRFAFTTRDRDGDGFPDSVDLCPDEPEDEDEYRDLDGCPEPDNDGDGILDDDDECPNVPGVPQNAGCPEHDKDRDGVIDDEDKCPNEPEDHNEFEDEDGCPDAAKRITVTKSLVEIQDAVYFETGKDVIKKESHGLLKAVAKVLKDLPPDKRVRISGHTDSKGNPEDNMDLSERRAAAVKAFFVKEGVPAARLEAKGYGQTQPIASNTTPQGRAKNRRVEFVLLDADEK